MTGLVLKATLCLSYGTCCAQLSANIRDGSGALRLINSGSTPYNLVGYSITFPTLDLQTSGWSPITSRLALPQDLAGTSFADSANNWVIFSPSQPTASNTNDLSEGTATGAGGTLLPGDSLYLGDIWDPQTSPFVTVFVANADNEFSSASLTYLSQGDYNEDGSVDVKDYNLWRDSLGTAGPGLLADGDGNGIVDVSDYKIWRDNIGATTLFGSLSAPLGLLSSTASIPEPGAAVLLAMALLATCGLSVPQVRRPRT